MCPERTPDSNQSSTATYRASRQAATPWRRCCHHGPQGTCCGCDRSGDQGGKAVVDRFRGAIADHQPHTISCPAKACGDRQDEGFDRICWLGRRVGRPTKSTPSDDEPRGLRARAYSVSSSRALGMGSRRCSVNFRAPTLASRVMTLASPDVGCWLRPRKKVNHEMTSTGAPATVESLGQAQDHFQSDRYCVPRRGRADRRSRASRETAP